MSKEVKLKAEELPSFFEFIGIEEAKDLADLKTKFAERWHTADTFFDSKEFKDHIGKHKGSLISNLRKAGREHGIDFSNSELQDKSPEEAVSMLLVRLQEANNTAMEELKRKSSGSKDEKYTTLETTFNNLKRDFDTLTEANRKIKADWDADKASAAANLKAEKLAFRTKDLYANFKWANGVDDLRKKGFMATITEKAKFDLDENDNLVVMDAQTGKKFSNPKVHTAFLSPDEFLMDEGISAKVYAQNPDGGKPAPTASGPQWGLHKNEQQTSTAKRTDLYVSAH